MLLDPRDVYQGNRRPPREPLPPPLLPRAAMIDPLIEAEWIRRLEEGDES
jgi:hypothetical protein